jgi:hypothetical protein
MRKKTKYLTTGVNKNKPKYFQIEKFKFEMVQSFTYLGSVIDANNNISAEIKKRILLANKGFYGIKRQFTWGDEVVRSPNFFLGNGSR